ncbi:MAG: ATP-binding cassette domain-containing protein [Ruminococcaceae bacterium]|nr:ATP-binding cassette domain-containing protein [Oscillospiraceae bacterium]
MAQLEIHNLSFSYSERAEDTVSDISFSVDKGQFVAVCGATGSGKTTLLRCLKRELTPFGDLRGEILLDGMPVSQLSDKDAACLIGYVMQRPEEQIVTDKVWHELAFGLENIGADQQSIRRRVAEMASYFGIEQWFDKSTAELSGGQKQLLNLASVMIMNPEVLILDEPTAQLDPIAAADFLSTIKRLNRDFALTVIIAEHRLEDIVPDCDRMLLMDKGRLLYFDSPGTAVKDLHSCSELLDSMPSAVRLYNELTPNDGDIPCPLDIRSGHEYISRVFDSRITALSLPEHRHSEHPALQFSECWFRYAKNSPDVLCGLDLTVYSGELFFILGGNGSGKTTALNAAAGLNRCYSGTIRVFGKKLSEYKNGSLYSGCLSMLTQDVQTVFLRPTVREELEEIELIEGFPFDFSAIMDMHPYDLSGGQQQMLALAKVLSAKPRLLLLDEPTKGLDAQSKKRTAELLRFLRSEGMTIVVVTHDVEFAAECADRCALFFRGEIISVDTPHRFFSENSFYTTAVSRMTRGIYTGAASLSDAVELCRANGRRDRE